MTSVYSKIYLDTSPIIYFLENSPLYALAVQKFIIANATQRNSFYTSVITNVEYLSKPMRENKNEFVMAYNNFKSAIAMQFLEVNEDISLLAVKLRAKYVFLKPIDSIHLATAIFIGCDIFLTNDKQLKQVSEVNVELVDDL